MNFETVPLFDKQFKKLSKKYNLIKSDVEELIINFDELHQQATPINQTFTKSDWQTVTRTKVKEQGIESIII